MTTPTVDRFDEIRRAWIAAHHGASTIQRRRAETLDAGLGRVNVPSPPPVPDPHDDTVIRRCGLRTAKSPAAQLELCIVTLAA